MWKRPFPIWLRKESSARWQDPTGRCVTGFNATTIGKILRGAVLLIHMAKSDMNWLFDTNWFAIHAKRFREKIAASSVSALGLEVFLPMVKVECPELETIRVASKALFTGYFFARFSPAVSLESVECARNVLQVIKSGSCPIPVEEEIVRDLQERVKTDGLIHLRQCEFKPGDRVAIQEGPFAGMIGKVESEPDERKRVAILLEALWQARVLIHARCVEAEAA